MKEKTKQDYRKLAAHFYKTRINGGVTPKKIIDALKICAPDYRPDYWRRLRDALKLVANESGFHKAADKIAATKNPVTSDPSRRDEIKPKQRRVRSVSESDESKLMDFLFEHEQMEVAAAVILVSHLGCRPAELMSIMFINEHDIAIPSAKVRDDRGVDRIVHIAEKSRVRSLKLCVEFLHNSTKKDPVRHAQRKLGEITKQLWPKRKARPSLYSWRHQMGSDLKASGKTLAQIATLMGHRSTDSVQVYGNRRSGTRARDYITPDKLIVRHVQRCNRHRLVPAAREALTLNSIAQAFEQVVTKANTC